jgi:hypothetical protein
LVIKLKKLIIHPGFHKTGTTSLQQALAASREDLRKENFYYPKIGGGAQHRAAWAVIEKTWGWKSKGGRKTAYTEWENLEKKIKKSKNTVLLSSEFFSEANQKQLERLKSRLNSFDTKIVFTWRPLPFLLASSYQQYLKYGIKASYEEWLHSIFDTPRESKITPSFWKRNLHGEVIRKWANIFGSENVSIISVDEKNPTFLFDSYASLAGIPADVLHLPGQAEINRSLTAAETALLLQINQNYPKDAHWDSYEVFIRKGNMRALTSSPVLDSSDEKLMTPKWAIDKAIEINKQNVIDIEKLGIKTIGNLNRDDFQSIPTGTNSQIDKISIATAAHAMIGVDLSLLNEVHGKDIAKEFYARARKVIHNKFKI